MANFLRFIINYAANIVSETVSHKLVTNPKFVRWVQRTNHKYLGGPKPDPYLEEMLKQQEKLQSQSISKWDQFSKIVKEEAQDVLKSYKPANGNNKPTNRNDKLE